MDSICQVTFSLIHLFCFLLCWFWLDSQLQVLFLCRQDGYSCPDLYFLMNIDPGECVGLLITESSSKAFLYLVGPNWLICLSINQITMAREYNVLIGLDPELHSNSMDEL